jgi:molecular chaperone HscB
MNYFEVFGLAQLLGIDTGALEKKFHELSRQYHPDYFTTAPADERSRALRMTALLNDAYRTLRNPIRRVEYLLSLHGLKADGSKVPKSLLMEVFEINEQLEDIRTSGGTESQMAELRQQIEEKRRRFDTELQQATAHWDELIRSGTAEPQLKIHLAKLAEVLSESSYIRNLEDELEGRDGHYKKLG